MTPRSTRERWALASLPPDDPLVLAEHRRLVEAVEQVHRSARLLGLSPVAQYAGISTRCDAWMWRVERDRKAWTAIFASPLFSGPIPVQREAA